MKASNRQAVEQERAMLRLCIEEKAEQDCEEHHTCIDTKLHSISFDLPLEDRGLIKDRLNRQSIMIFEGYIPLFVSSRGQCDSEDRVAILQTALSPHLLRCNQISL